MRFVFVFVWVFSCRPAPRCPPALSPQPSPPLRAAGCGGGGSPQDELHREGNWFEPKYGEGASCYFCHVIVPKSHYDLLPPKRPDEVEQLAQYPFPEDMTDTSRLACQVVLTKEMDGMVIYIPDGPPSDLP